MLARPPQQMHHQCSRIPPLAHCPIFQSLAAAADLPLVELVEQRACHSSSCPLAEDRRTKCPVLRPQLHQIEADKLAQHAVFGGKGFRRCRRSQPF